MSFTASGRNPYDYGWRPPTTMVDVMFLILAFFITIAALNDEDRQLPVDLPATESVRADPRVRMQTMVTVTADGGVYLGDQPTTLDALQLKLTELVRQSPDESLVIRGDRSSVLDATVQVMDIARQAGIQHIYVGTLQAEPRH